LAAPAAEEDCGITQRTAIIAVIASGPETARWHVVDLIAAQAPQEEAHIFEVIPAGKLLRRAHVYRVADGVKRSIEPVHGLHTSDIGRAQAVRPQMVAYVLRPAE